VWTGFQGFSKSEGLISIYPNGKIGRSTPLESSKENSQQKDGGLPFSLF
jgi:hypothetical protein